MANFNMQPNKNQMPMQDPVARGKNFEEVALGYTKEQALSEANRCINCKNPACVKGCPVAVNIPAFINEIKNDNIDGAYAIIANTSNLPAICGRVCPQETQCEAKCVRGIKCEPVAIGRLERYVADNATVKATEITKKNGHKVAVVGSGPAGLTVAGDLIKLGYSVTVYEAFHTEGGVLVYGIPEFRLPKKIVKSEVEKLQAMGVEFVRNVIIGKTLTVDELFEMGFKAVFIGSGAGLPNFMNIPGESYKGVYSANEFLTRSNLMKAYKENSTTPIMKGGKVAVVGGGNVAMDAARTALRLGAEKVTIIYRRSMEELPARKEEVENAIEEGIEFKLLCNPVKIDAYFNENDKRDPKNGFVKSITSIKMELGEPDEYGRRRPIPVPNSEFETEVNTVIMAIGTSPNPLIKDTTSGLDVNRRGGIIVTEEGATTKQGVYAGGDAVTGASTVISAMGAGKIAAKAIDEYIKSKA
ncbi:MAG: NADPH-dependent glutamate synthase [Clostridia bacterium]|nr:NADPH-dependent glutamate synthase [Clostridia bacterium]